MSLPVSKFKKNILASAMGLVLISTAPNVLATVIEANVDYSLNNAAFTTDNESSTGIPLSVDLLDGFSETGADVFYHTYGNTSGHFGSRVSGSGTFDITGTFQFDETFTNNTGISQDYELDFTIIAGEVMNSFDALIAGQSLYSAYFIDVMVDGSSLFRSSVEIESSSAGSTISKDDTVLAGPADGTSSVSWGQHTESLLLGTLADGDSFDFQYLLTTTASGMGLTNNDCGEGDDGGDNVFAAFALDGDGDGAFGCNTAIARIGDPFGIQGAQTNIISVNSQPTNAVPEPTGLALLGLGLSALLVNRRRKVKK